LPSTTTNNTAQSTTINKWREKDKKDKDSKLIVVAFELDENLIIETESTPFLWFSREIED